MIQEVHWHGEDDGGVVLGSDTAQGLKVPELQLQSSGYNIRAREEADLGDARAGRPPPPLLLKKGQRFMSPLPLILKRPLAVIYLQGRGALGNNVSSFPQGS